MSRLVRLVAATALVAATGLTVAAPAYAEACSSDSGVTVVVDFHELGGGIEQGCVADQGTADDLFVAAGHTLQSVNGQAFVCRVDGLPTQEQESCARTPPEDAYWGLWWSDGESGSWTYATLGAYSLDVPDGGAVAFSWNGSSTRSEPGSPPPQHESAEDPSEEPEPTRNPTTQPPTSGGGGTSDGGGTSSTASTPTGSASGAPETGDRGGRRDDDRVDEKSDREKRGDRDREEPPAGPTDGPSATPTDDAATVAEPPASGDDSALPVWVGPTAFGGLLAVAGAATYLRRRMS